MNPHDWYIEHRIDFVARTLDAAEERSFADHLRRCEECTAEVRTIERDLAWLPMGTDPVQPRPGFQRLLTQTLLGERRPAWHRWVAPLAVAASLLLAVGLYLPERRETGRLATALAERTDELVALRDSLSVMHQAARVLQARIPMEGRDAGLLIFADDVSHRWNVVVHGLPPAAPGEKYQFWFIRADGMVRGATVSSAPGRPAIFMTDMPEGGGTVMGAELTVELVSNVSSQPRGRPLAKVML